MRIRAALLFAFVAGSTLVTASCAWSRFEDLKENVPVVEIEEPGGMPGFGTTMATIPYQNNTRLMVLGEPNLVPKAAAYDIVNDEPSSSPSSSGFCDNKRCIFGDSPAPLNTLTIDGASHSACFVLGVGDRNNSLGLVGSCADGTNFVLPVAGEDPRFPQIETPQDVISQDLTAANLGSLMVADFRYAASDDAQPVIAASSKFLGASWFYPAGSKDPVAITLLFPPEDDPNPQSPDDPRDRYGFTFGNEIAVASVAQGGHLIAIATPQGVGEVESAIWLFRELDGKIVHDGPNPDQPAPVGCLPGFTRNFGTYMHTGRLFGGNSDELFISDGATISIYDAGVLAENPPTTGCNGPPLGSAGYLTGVTCVGTSTVTGCSSVRTGFGRSIAIADVDGNGENELVVGAPMLAVDGTQGAGAVLVYDVDRTGEQTRLLEARIISSRDTGDALGASVAGLRIGSRDVIAAGASGLGSFFLFYCSTAGGSGKSSSRCE